MSWYQNKSDEDIRRESLIDEGDYSFEVLSAERKKSKADNWMIQLTVRIWDLQGRTRQIMDWLLEMEGQRYKIKQFCKATGMINEYDSGTFDADICPGKSGKLHLKIAKDRDGKEQNRVAAYLDPIDVAFNSTKESVSKLPEINDDVPF